jgi:hypothetical protein
MYMQPGAFSCRQGTDREIVAPGINNNLVPLFAAEYAEYMDANVIFYVEDELTPAGLKAHMDDLRATFIPVLSRIDLSKE